MLENVFLTGFVASSAWLRTLDLNVGEYIFEWLLASNSRFTCWIIYFWMASWLLASNSRFKCWIIYFWLLAYGRNDWLQNVLIRKNLCFIKGAGSWAKNWLMTNPKWSTFRITSQYVLPEDINVFSFIKIILLKNKLTIVLSIRNQ